MDANLLLLIESEEYNHLLRLIELENEFEDFIGEYTEDLTLLQDRKETCTSTYKPQHAIFRELNVLLNNDDMLKEHLRLERKHFDMLVEHLKGMAKENVKSMPLERRIAIAMTALGSSSEYGVVGDMFGVSSALVRQILEEFCKDVKRVLGPLYLPSNFLTQQKVEKCVQGFEALGFPQCFGVLDACHIEVLQTAEVAKVHKNDKGWHSTILLALVDYRCRFLYVNVGYPGRCHDDEVYESSTLKKMLMESSLLQANSKRIAEIDVPVVLLADSAFKFSETLMKPYPYRWEASDDEQRFNYAHANVCRVAENAFDQLKARFRRIGAGQHNEYDRAPLVVMACCILHNFLNYLNCAMPDREDIAVLEQPEHVKQTNDNEEAAECIRKAIIAYLKDKE